MDHLMTSAARPLASRVLGKNHLESIKREVMEEYFESSSCFGWFGRNRYLRKNAVYAKFTKPPPESPLKIFFHHFQSP